MIVAALVLTGMTVGVSDRDAGVAGEGQKIGDAFVSRPQCAFLGNRLAHHRLVITRRCTHCSAITVLSSVRTARSISSKPRVSDRFSRVVGIGAS